MKQSPNIPTKKADSLSPEALLAYYWNYFQLQSNQRLQMVNFFISIEVALIGAFCVLIVRETSILWAKCIITSMITFFALTFYGLEYRTRQLLDMCRNRIEKLEENHISLGREYHLISQGRILTKTKNTKITYSTIFALQYCVIGCFGIISLILSCCGII